MQKRKKSYKKKKNQKNNELKNNKLNNKALFVIGTLSINARKSFGFVSPEDTSVFSQDIFIAQKSLCGAIDGDLVKVKVVLDKKYPEDNPRWKGSIEMVLKRNKSHILGFVSHIINEKYIEAHVPSLGPEKCIKVEIVDNYSPVLGDRIMIENIPWTKKRSKDRPVPKMSEYLGGLLCTLTDRIALEKEFNITEKFPAAVDIQANSFLAKHIQKECDLTEKFSSVANITTHSLLTKKFEKTSKKRIDLRSLLCFTIDSKTAKDFDDAVSLSLNENNEYVLGVHIADVSHYVTKNSALDKEAKERCNSVYFPGHVIPMLPHNLSNNLCSLKPNVNRLAISVFMILDQEGCLQSYTIKRSVIRSKYRMTYDQVNSILENKKQHALKDNLLLMFELSKKLQLLKAKRGCFNFAIPTLGFKFDDLEAPYDIFYSSQTQAHQLIEEFMLQANETIAKHAFTQGLTLPYRIHEQPDPLQLEAFKEFIISLGLSVNYYDKDNNFDYQALLNDTQGHILNYLIHSSFIRSMKMASYSIENKGHYGLHLEYYTHFTSPIRRYIDLCLHRILFDEESFSKEELEVIVKQCSQKGRLTVKLEQNYDKIKKIRFFSKLYQDDPERSYSARIISLKQQAVTFCLPEFLYEDTLVSPLPLNNPLNEKQNHALLQIGNEVCVKIHKIDLIFLKIEWQFCPTFLKKIKKTQKKYKTKKIKNDS